MGKTIKKTDTSKKSDENVKGENVSSSPKKKTAKKASKSAIADSDKKVSKAETKKEDVKTADTKEQKTVDVEKKEKQEKREPQFVTVNGDKITHAHTYEYINKAGEKNYYFTARMNGEPLPPRKMDGNIVSNAAELKAILPQMLQKYYPSQLAKTFSKEEFNANKLSNGSAFDKMNIYKETKADENGVKQETGKWKVYAQVGDKKMSDYVSPKEVTDYFGHKTTKAAIVENHFGERLNLASAYEKYKLPNEEGVVSGIYVSKMGENKEDNHKWGITARVNGDRQPSKELSFDDKMSLFNKKTATKEQLTAKYFDKEIDTALKQRAEAKKEYEGFKLPEGDRVNDIRVASQKDGSFRISANIDGNKLEKNIDNLDGIAFRFKHTATGEQLAAKYFDKEIKNPAPKAEQKAVVSRGMKI